MSERSWPPQRTKFVLLVLTEDVSVEEADESVETGEDDQIDSGGLIHTSPPHEEKPEKSPNLPSVEDVLSVGDRHDVSGRVSARLQTEVRW